MSVGSEDAKGNEVVKKTRELMKADPNLKFIGNIEGRDVFHGNIDVLVTDGFTGNVFLKTAEGIADFILDQIESLGPLASLPPIKSILATLRQRLHYTEHPGAILCGIDGIVIKCHGASTAKAFINSIKGASRLIKHSFIEQIKAELQ